MGSVLHGDSDFTASGARESADQSGDLGWPAIHSGLPVRWDLRNTANTVARRRALRIKRLIDVVGSLTALVLLSPILFGLAVAIKVSSPGPVFFRQEREGKDGRVFEMVKFRTMHQQHSDPSGHRHTVPGDTRVTALGRVLRKRSLDELPQLLNVVRGEMSLVGPRPHVPGMMAAGQSYRDLVPYYEERLKVVPGMTGWAQANGLRGPTSDPSKARERIEHDIDYIRNFSVWLDLKIMVVTIQREILRGTGS